MEVLMNLLCNMEINQVIILEEILILVEDFQVVDHQVEDFLEVEATVGKIFFNL